MNIRLYTVFLVSVILFTIFTATSAFPQDTSLEPKVKPKPEPVTLSDKGLKRGMGFNLAVNNFGFVGAAHYRQVIAPMTQLVANLKFGPIRDPSEQTFQSIFGQQIIPNKFRRGIAIPLTLGIKRRIFAHAIEDNFRLYVKGAGGPSFTLLIPYFEDLNNDKIRNLGRNFFGEADFPVEPVNDFFQGWGDAETEWGINGDIAVGVDFGDNFSRISTVEFGFDFFFYPQGLQILEPRRFDPEVSTPSNPEFESFNDDKKFFATPQISLIFGGMW